MILPFVVAFFTLITLIVIHEFGHFLLAKKFGVEVEEFGIGYPPRLLSKRVGETLYSLNLIPFGAFVKIKGEEGGIEDYRSFSEKPMYQRVLIVIGGVFSFWLVSTLLLSIVFGLGAPMAVKDSATGVENPKVQIATVSKESPAFKAGLKPLDTILELNNSSGFKPDKVKQVQQFVDENKGREITLTIKRWSEIKQVSLTPRVSPPENEGAMGVTLVRTALKSSSLWKAPLNGVIASAELTWNAIKGLSSLVLRVFKGEGLPTGAKPMGPLGIFDFLNQAFLLGINYFLYFVAIISIFLAIFNILPIPALDGGKLLFLGIEKVRGEPVSPKVEQRITNFFFFLLIAFMIFVTIRFDIPRLF